MRRLLLAPLMAIAFATPALAQSQCVRPVAPAIPDGARATKTQITKALDEVKRFVAASDAYQACMLGEINANQKEKERVGAEYGASARAYNSAQQQQQMANRPGPFTPPGSMGGAGVGSGGF